MIISKIIVKNYKLLRDVAIDLNPTMNIFVGDNDAGKTTILEALAILTTGKLNGYAFDRQIKAAIFNSQVRSKYISEVISNKNTPPPKIVFEAYLNGDAQFKGTQNTLFEDVSGINITVDITPDNAGVYRRMLDEDKIKDIPVELYGVSYHYFNGEPLSYRYPPFKSVFIDTGKKDYYNLIDHFVSDSIAEILTPSELTDIAIAYKSSRRTFQYDSVVSRLNESVRKHSVIHEKQVSLCLREDENDAWKKQMSISVDDIPFEYVGYGTQNAIKIELALRNADTQANVVLMEEPENNLSFSNMTSLIGEIAQSVGKQIFISTHSSYVSNKLNLTHLLLVKGGRVSSLASLSKETKNYFVKMPGYDTLRFVLAPKVILVEGTTDDLIIQRAYLDRYGRLPAEDGIDVFVVDSLAFKRFCEIGKLIRKSMVVVTDNDGNIDANIKKKYREYYDDDIFSFYYETNELLNTIEPSVLSVNCADSGEPSDTFKQILSANDSLVGRDYNGILSFMYNNKSEWALRVFQSNETINYPRYIHDVIEHFHECS